MVDNSNLILSIIIPVYNVENFLNRCLDSILIQNINNIEILLINDGSTDNSYSICEDYKTKYNCIKLINQDNKGLSFVKNLGLSLAKGQYISFIDSDDYLSQDFYKKNLDILINNKKIDLLVLQHCKVYPNYKKFYHNKNEILNSKEGILNYIFSDNYIGSSWINIYKKEILKNISFPDNKIYEDGYILPDLVSKINTIYISNIGFYYYVIREGSITRNKKKLKDWQDILDCHFLLLQYCKSLTFNKKLFYNKFKLCHLSYFYACLNYNYEIKKYYYKEFLSLFKYLTIHDIIIAEKKILSKILIKKILGINRTMFIYRVYYKIIK